MTKNLCQIFGDAPCDGMKWIIRIITLVIFLLTMILGAMVLRFFLQRFCGIARPYERAYVAVRQCLFLIWFGPSAQEDEEDARQRAREAARAVDAAAGAAPDGAGAAAPAAAAGAAQAGQAEVPMTDRAVEGSCPICLVEFGDGQQLAVLPCDPEHRLHWRCWIHWMRNKAECPLCRSPALSDTVICVTYSPQLRGFGSAYQLQYEPSPPPVPDLDAERPAPLAPTSPTSGAGSPPSRSPSAGRRGARSPPPPLAASAAAALPTAASAQLATAARAAAAGAASGSPKLRGAGAAKHATAAARSPPPPAARGEHNPWARVSASAAEHSDSSDDAPRRPRGPSSAPPRPPRPPASRSPPPAAPRRPSAGGGRRPSSGARRLRN